MHCDEHTVVTAREAIGFRSLRVAELSGTLIGLVCLHFPQAPAFLQPFDAHECLLPLELERVIEGSTPQVSEYLRCPRVTQPMSATNAASLLPRA